MAGSVIDLRENPNVDMAIAQNIGQSINMGIQEYRRVKLQTGIVRTLQRGTAEGWTPDQTRQELLRLPDIVNTEIGQEIFQAQTGTGRYYQNPLTRQYLQSRINSNDALIKKREGDNELKSFKDYQKIYNDAAEQYSTLTASKLIEPDPEILKQLQAQMAYGKRGMAQYNPANTNQVQKTNMTPQNVDAVTMAAPINQNQQQTVQPAFIGQPAAATPTIQNTPTPETAGPQWPSNLAPVGSHRKWESMNPAQRYKYHTGKDIEEYEPPSQSDFENIVKQIALTDRETAKRYYDKWASKWQ